MADVKISALSNASTPLAGTEVVPVVQGGVTYKTAVSNIAALASSGVTSVGMTVPTGLSVTGSPITSTGTLAVSYSAGYSIPTTSKQSEWDTAYGWGNHASAGYLTSATAATTYQPLDGDLTAIAGLSGTSGLLKKTAANTWTLDTTAYLSGTVAIANGGTGGTTASTARSNLLPSYTTNATKVLAVNAGATDVEWITVSGGGGSGTVTSITAGTGLSGGTITTSGTIALNTAYGDSVNPYEAKTANYILAAPNGSSGVPSFRALVAADVPTLNQSTTGNAATATALQTARTINGVSFDGTANITVADSTKLPLAGGTMTGAITFAAGQTWPTFNQNTTGTAAAIAGGAANQLVYQSGSGVSTFVTAPTVTDTYLKWNGTTFTWATVSGGGSGTVTSVDVSGGTTGLTTSGGPITSSGTITLAGTLAVANGGSGQTSYTDGQLLIGNSTGNTLTKATLTAGSGISITNGSGSITISASGGGSGITTGKAIAMAIVFG